MESWQFWMAIAGLFTTMVLSMIGAGVAAVKATWWLSERFADVTQAVTAATATAAAALNVHEVKDNERHEQNLERFADINENLATLIRRPEK